MGIAVAGNLAAGIPRPRGVFQEHDRSAGFAGAHSTGGMTEVLWGTFATCHYAMGTLETCPTTNSRRKMMNVLITGGAGFVGSHLADRLLTRGDRVTVIDNFATGRRDNLSPHVNLNLIEGTIADADL